MKMPPKRLADSRNRLLKMAGVLPVFKQADIDWPSIEPITDRVVAFLSPVLVHNDVNVAGRLLGRAFEAYREKRPESPALAFRAYLQELTSIATFLSQIRISIQDRDGIWMIWDYDEPLVERLDDAMRYVVRTTEREQPLPVGPILIKFLAQTIKTKDMVAHGGSGLLEMEAME